MALCRQLLRTSGLVRQCSKITTNVCQRRTYAAEAESNEMKFTFASTSDVFYDSAVVKQVDVPGYASTFGILAKHVPTLAVLKPGVMTVYEEDNSQKKFFVSSGTVTVNPDSTVQVLTEEAHPLERFDKEEIKQGLAKAQQELASSSGDREKAEAQIAVDTYEALNKAME